MLAPSRNRRSRRILVDLTPMQPRGANGGAKHLARALVRELGLLAPDIQFTLLTAPVSDAECADLETANVRRQRVDVHLEASLSSEGSPRHARRSALHSGRAATRVVLDNFLPSSARASVKDRLWTIVKRRHRSAIVARARADLIVCPFTAPLYFDARVPLVSIVHDLQFLDHPEFFDDADRAFRTEHFLAACERADRLICVSEFVRQSVLRSRVVPPSRVRTIHSTVLRELASPEHSRDRLARVLTSTGIASPRYLLYPANVWPHKNHRRLIEAFANYLEFCPESDLTLICTGADNQAAADLAAFAAGRLPTHRFAFAGFLADGDFDVLLAHCRALIYPSLYEGFGLPVLEGMAAGRPVLCSTAGSLSEVAGDAALTFDPTRLDAIANAIRTLERNPQLEQTLVSRGVARAASFGSPHDWAARYLAAFETVIAERTLS